MTQFIARAYNNLTLDAKFGTITKISSQKKLASEILYYRAVEKLPNGHVGVFFPRCFSSHSTSGPYSLEMEYYPFDNLGSLLMSDNFDEETWTKIVDSLKTILQRFSEVHSSQVDNLALDRRLMFLDKTLREYQTLVKQSEFFREFTLHKQIEINGISYWNFDELWQRIVPLVEGFCTEEPFSMVHGDMCFSNILCGFDKHKNPVVKLVDPRGSFGSHTGIFGDPAYDLAKLKHSVSGKYELIIYDQFSIKPSEGTEPSLTYGFPEDSQKNCSKVWKLMSEELIPAGDHLKVGIIEGLIYIGMCARHYDSLDRQKIMYSTGIRLLNEALDIVGN